MYVGRDFPAHDEGESRPYTFNFVRDIAEGDAINAAVWHCTVAEDSETPDDAAADHVSAPPPTFEGTKTSQHVSGLVAGVKYVLQAVVTTEQGSTASLWSHVVCTVPK